MPGPGGTAGGKYEAARGGHHSGHPGLGTGRPGFRAQIHPTLTVFSKHVLQASHYPGPWVKGEQRPGSSCFLELTFTL